jgi:DNA-binding response OmpR family regulator
MTARDASAEFTVPTAARAVLCVTADGPSAEVYGRVLWQYEIVIARTGFDGLREMNARAFDAYVLDYWFPDWNGVGLCRSIRGVDPYGPILFCSSAPTEKEKARARRAGASDYLPKPVDPMALRLKLGSLLGRADYESLKAKVAEERAIHDELQRQVLALKQRVVAANNLRAASIERVARAKALRAFFDAGGTRAHFDRWWPQVFGSVQAKERP